MRADLFGCYVDALPKLHAEETLKQLSIAISGNSACYKMSTIRQMENDLRATIRPCRSGIEMDPASMKKVTAALASKGIEVIGGN